MQYLNKSVSTHTNPYLMPCVDTPSAKSHINAIHTSVPGIALTSFFNESHIPDFPPSERQYENRCEYQS